MSDDPRIAEVQRRLFQPVSVEDVRGTLPVLDELSVSSDLERASEEGLRRAFACLRELTASEPDMAIEILINDLLPRCLVQDKADDRGYGYRHCHTFGEW